MLKPHRWDIYTIIIVALVPAMLLSAWGLTAWDQRQLHSRQCAMAEDWLDSTAAFAGQFEMAGRTGQTQLWITNIENLDFPNAARDLRSGLIRSARYHQEFLPNVSTREPGVLNPVNGLYERQIETGIAALTSHCPETAELIPAAVPMIFREDEQ